MATYLLPAAAPHPAPNARSDNVGRGRLAIALVLILVLLPVLWSMLRPRHEPAAIDLAPAHRSLAQLGTPVPGAVEHGARTYAECATMQCAALARTFNLTQPLTLGDALAAVYGWAEVRQATLSGYVTCGGPATDPAGAPIGNCAGLWTVPGVADAVQVSFTFVAPTEVAAGSWRTYANRTVASVSTLVDVRAPGHDD